MGSPAGELAMIETLALVGGLTSLLLVGVKGMHDRYRAGPGNKPLDGRWYWLGIVAGAVAAIAWKLRR